MEEKMKKTIVTMLCLLMAFVMVGCKKPPVVEETTPLEYLGYLTTTIDEYKNSDSGSILIEMNTDVETSLEYIYNFTSSSIDSLLCVFESGDSVMAAYVTEEVSYINVNNEKTQTPLTVDEEETILENYGLEAMTASIFATFDQSLFNAFTVTSDEAGVVVLTWDKTKYVLITTGLDDDGILAAGERYDDVSANMKAITVTLTYADSKVTKVESSWTKNDDSVGAITVEFKGTGAQTIVFPTDLASYTEQQN